MFQTQYFLAAWKHARMFSILKPGKEPALPSYYRPISLLETTGKLFEKIILSRILYQVSRRRLLRDEQFGFRPKHCATARSTCRKSIQELLREENNRRNFLGCG